MKGIRIKKLGRIVISHTNIRSVRNKFELLAGAIMAYVAILMVTEIRADESFAAGQFIVPAITHGIFKTNSCFRVR